MAESIRGISKSSLWKAWKAVRSEIKKCSVRDVVDFLEYDIDPDKWIARLLHDLAAGAYEPHRPFRFSEAKSGGLSRQMTMPAIPDIVLYRAIVDYLYSKANRFEQEQVFCERSDLPPRVKKAKAAGQLASIWRRIGDAWTDYETSSKKGFRAWLLYDQYRRWLAFTKVHKFIVTTDVTNFFDSVLYSRIADTFHRISAPPRMVGLLFFLLERLSIRDAYSESPRIGLPVDEFACSRKIAHMVLFPHDERMVSIFGEKAYVRWMDDQNFGVSSRADGLRCLATVSQSLARLHLTANAKKSLLMSVTTARRYFHFDLNRMLDDAEDLPTATTAERKALAKKVNEVIRKARPHRGIGQWEKILKRLYKVASIAGVRALRAQAVPEALRSPRLIRRIADYMRRTGTVKEYLTFVQSGWNHPEQVYADVNAALFESLLRLEPDKTDAITIRTLASGALKKTLVIAGLERCKAVAPLLILRFGNYRSFPLLRSGFAGDNDRESERSCAVVYAGANVARSGEVRKAAGARLHNHLAVLVKMLDAISEYDVPPSRWNLRAEPIFDSVSKSKYVDMRGLVAIRLLGLNAKPTVKAWLTDKRKQLLAQPLSVFDRAVVLRLWPK